MPGIHKRFDSASDGSDDDTQASLAVSLPTDQPGSQSQVVEDSSDSDSDAPPEAVSASAALSATKAARQKISAAARHAEESERQKRKKLDAARVKQTNRRRQIKEAQADRVEKEEEEELHESSSEDEDDGPAPLALEVLAAAESEREQAAARKLQASQRVDEQKSRKRKFENLTKAKSIKDVKVGSTRVRVLATQPKTMPPTNTVRKLSVRDAVLAGIKSRAKGPTKFSSLEGTRKPWKNGFVKKK